MTTWTPRGAPATARSSSPTTASPARTGSPLLLVMGLAISRFWWPTGLCDAFARRRLRGRPVRPARRGRVDPAARRRRVEPVPGPVREDGRRLHRRGHGRRRRRRAGRARLGLGPRLRALAGRRRRPAPRPAPPRPGAQRLSSAALPSDVSGLGVFRYLRFGPLAKFARIKFPEGREGDIAAGRAVARALASPAYPFDEAGARDWVDPGGHRSARHERPDPPDRGPWHGPSLAELTRPPHWCCTARTTRLCVSSPPPGPPPRRSPAPGSSSSPASATTSPRAVADGRARGRRPGEAGGCGLSGQAPTPLSSAAASSFSGSRSTARRRSSAAGPVSPSTRCAHPVIAHACDDSGRTVVHTSRRGRTSSGRCSSMAPQTASSKCPSSTSTWAGTAAPAGGTSRPQPPCPPPRGLLPPAG